MVWDGCCFGKGKGSPIDVVDFVGTMWAYDVLRGDLVAEGICCPSTERIELGFHVRDGEIRKVVDFGTVKAC